LKNKEGYKELGKDYLDSRKKDKVTKRYIKKLENLGYNVMLEEAA
jgi:hypothetical protein